MEFPCGVLWRRPLIAGCLSLQRFGIDLLSCEVAWGGAIRKVQKSRGPRAAQTGRSRQASSRPPSRLSERHGKRSCHQLSWASNASSPSTASWVSLAPSKRPCTGLKAGEGISREDALEELLKLEADYVYTYKHIYIYICIYIHTHIYRVYTYIMYICHDTAQHMTRTYE